MAAYPCGRKAAWLGGPVPGGSRVIWVAGAPRYDAASIASVFSGWPQGPAGDSAVAGSCARKAPSLAGPVAGGSCTVCKRAEA